MGKYGKDSAVHFARLRSLPQGDGKFVDGVLTTDGCMARYAEREDDTLTVQPPPMAPRNRAVYLEGLAQNLAIQFKNPRILADFDLLESLDDQQDFIRRIQNGELIP